MGVTRAPRAIGILGGTFDPVHVGHLALAREALRTLDLERVLFVPNAQPPHKDSRDVSPAHQREAMLALAIEGEPAFELSRVELERAGPSYAVDTVAELAALSRTAGRPEPWFILSAEVLDDFHTWRQPQRILDLCRVAVSPRSGAQPLDRHWLSAHFPGREDRFAFLPGPVLDVASTTIRERVAAGEPIGGLVPPSVERYIRASGLYRGAAAGSIIDGIDAEEGEGQVADEQESTMIDGEADGSAADPRAATPRGLPSRRHPVRPGASRGEGVIDPGPVDEAALAMAHRIVELASAKKASDIVLLDVRGQTTMTDYFVICSGASDRQLGAIADGITEGLHADGTSLLSREGDASSHWVLLDVGGVIVHVMSGPEREFYQLEKLWSNASLLLHIV
jgi:nicotinate-nucleotide adenylyltransferase